MKSVLFEFEKLKDLHSGLGQFCFRLGLEFIKLNKEFEPIFFTHKNATNTFGPEYRYEISSRYKRYLDFLLPKADIWHLTHQDSPFTPPKNSKVVLTIHDLNFLYKKHKSHSLLLMKIQKKIDRADHIAFVSKFTSDLCHERLSLKNKSNSIIYNGLSLNYRDHDNQFPRKKDYKNFIFSIGIMTEKKNFHTLIPMMKKLIDYELVIAGKKDTRYGKEILELIKKHDLHQRVHLIGNVSEEEKIWYYQHCKAFVFPSMQEGFGMPVIEAMSFSKPVFVSTFTSLPEIAGPYGFYFNSFNPEEMANTIISGLTQYEIVPELKQNIQNWSQKFSWQNACLEYFKIYKSL